MSKPRKHHYLPQFYLRGFSPNGRQITQVAKASLRVTTGSVRDFAAARDYHRIEGDGDPHRLEKALASIEAQQGHLLSGVLLARTVPPSARADLMQLVSLMMFRVPAVKLGIERHLMAVVKNTHTMMTRRGSLPPLPPQLAHLGPDAFDIEIANWAVLQHMFTLAFDPDIISLFLRMTATVAIAPEDSPFITGDQPVAMFNAAARSTDPYGIGIAHLDTVLSFPLSSQQLLLLSWDPAQPPSAHFTPAQVQEFNRRTATMAQSYVFCSRVDEELLALLNRCAGQRAGIQPPESLDAGSAMFMLLHSRPVLSSDIGDPAV